MNNPPILGPNGQPVSPTPTRADQRQYERAIADLHRPGRTLERLPRDGDLRTVPCSIPEHPWHVHVYNSRGLGGKGEWVRCDDDQPIPAAILAILATPSPLEEFEAMVPDSFDGDTGSDQLGEYEIIPPADLPAPDM